MKHIDAIEHEAVVHPDDIAINRFADAMKAKMAKQRAKGYGGWNDKNDCPTNRLQQMLVNHISKGDPVDVANFAMMLWSRGERTEQPAQQEHDDSLLLCASDLEHSAIYDNHAEMQSCIRAVASRIKTLATPRPAQQQDGEAITQTFTGLPKRKLNELLSAGWQINGVCFQRTEEDGTVRRGAATTGGMVLWWNQPAQQQEPVAIVADHPERIDWLRDEPPDGTLLYTSPQPSKPWVGDWIWAWLMDWCKRNGASPASYDSLFKMVTEARAIEAKLREKNA